MSQGNTTARQAARQLAELNTTKQLAEYLGVTTRTLERWRETRVGPAWVHVGRKVRYRREDVEAWLQARRQTPVREEVA